MKNQKKLKGTEKNNNSGITLIALIVTIIVLIILAGVAIAMLRGDNGIINRATEVKTANGVSQFDEAVKLAFMSAKTNIEAKKVSTPGYIATTKDNTAAIANEIAKELGLNAATEAPAAQGTKINTEGYTVAYYYQDKPGNASTDGQTFAVIWYTDNSLRSTLNRTEAITTYGLIDVATNKSVNQAVLVAVIQIGNYTAELSGKGLTSTTDADGGTDGNGDITKGKFEQTSLKQELGVKSNNVQKMISFSINVNEDGSDRGTYNFTCIEGMNWLDWAESSEEPFYTDAYGNCCLFEGSLQEMILMKTDLDSGIDDGRSYTFLKVYNGEYYDYVKRGDLIREGVTYRLESWED